MTLRISQRVVVWGCLMAAALDASPAMAAEPSVRIPSELIEAIRELPIQHGGRHKPFDSFARESLDLITGSPRVGRADPVATVLSIIVEPEAWQDRPLLSVPFLPLQEALGVDRKTTHVAYNELLATRTLMRMLPPIVQKQQRDEKLTMLEQETMDLYERFVSLSLLMEQRLELVPPPVGSPDPSWTPILQPVGHVPERQAALREAWSAFILAAREGHQPEALAALNALSSSLREINLAASPAPWRLRLEVLYHRVAPFRIARWLYALAALALLLRFRRRRQPALALGGGALLWAAFGLHAAGILVRVVVGGRPPVSNFYETMLWLPFVAMVVALVFDHLHRVRFFGVSAAVLCAITLALADRLPLDPSISPVVAVLRSTLWLTVHVLTIVASYGALALATVLAHGYGVQFLLRRERGDAALASMELFLYRAIQVGVVLLAGGIMLGAVWANASWGRYWGWDPKETWALITLLWFVAALHGRMTGWIHGVGLALATIAGFFLLLMTYYGVSFYLVGLHSYAGGHAKPLPPLLIAYVIAEIAFMAAIGVSMASRRKSA